MKQVLSQSAQLYRFTCSGHEMMQHGLEAKGKARERNQSNRKVKVKEGKEGGPGTSSGFLDRNGN